MPGQVLAYKNRAMQLQQFAHEIFSLCEDHATTPVLVTPRYLSLRTRFFVELVAALEEQSSRSIRIDWYRGVPGPLSLLADRLALVKATRINRALTRRRSGGVLAATVQITASIARPGYKRHDLIVGLSEARLELPPWTTAIHLGATPDEFFALQSTPSHS